MPTGNRMPIIKANGININFEESGSGEPLLLIMGITAPWSVWEEHSKFWSKSFRCIMPDNRGVGHSDKPSGDYSSAMMADDHAALLQELGIDNVQNLAHFNFIMLIVKTPFPIRTLIDWAAQAKLITEFQEDYLALRKAGIRTTLDYLDAFEEKDFQASLERIHVVTQINTVELEVNYKNLKFDQSIHLLEHLRGNLEQFNFVVPENKDIQPSIEKEYTF